LLALARSGAVSIHAQTYPLEKASEVYGSMLDGSLQGRAVLVP
jgi:alcohol dehydrogenase, propanol-preferring